MSTPAQVYANRLNARHSTGAKTEAGKAASADNNTKHNLTGHFHVLPNEDETEFIQLLLDLVNEHNPTTRTEEILVEKMAQHHWRSQRALYMQENCLQMPDNAPAIGLGLILRYQTTHDRAFHKCLEQLVKLRTERRKEQIGFESQKRLQAAQEASDANKQADETRRQEVHQAKVRLLNSKAALTELDANIKGTLEAKFPGHTAIPFTDIKPFLETAIQDFVNYKTAKAA
jgi:hypothetical protein